jgi:hypothetical protein
MKAAMAYRGLKIVKIDKIIKVASRQDAELPRRQGG